jgi:hypothetical protein
MSSPNEHSRMLNVAAKRALQPLGFQQRGQSRFWFADRGFWALTVEFQPHGRVKGSFLNIGARWFWHPGEDWVFSYFQRIGGFIPFTTVEQFKPEAEKLANLAGAEAISLDQRFESLDAIAGYLKERASGEQNCRNPWMLYYAAITAGLTRDREFSLKCFSKLIAQEPTVDWMRKLQNDATTLKRLLMKGNQFDTAIRKKVAETRALLRLPPLGDTH